ncbi:Rieske (2Fe-2S) protein [Gordonia alkaliphila]|uniref:Cytochrome bc1 complex Rieske iron-sulfur subunit n=1 Tax=Gordonia alkaliphila TaxID=1053547 RepID=A0ABP8Z6X2_9ACTN|nr:Rieske (2Fe-2S) protein [Gordonia alkaliphila]MCK0440867.1 Rieske (2Fe-2S) protein [Gordonia alkaliphila]
MNEPQHSTPTCTSCSAHGKQAPHVGRRAVLAGAGAAAVTLAAAACSTAPPAAQPEPTVELPDGTTILATVDQVPTGSGLLVGDTDQILVTQPVAGTFEAFSAVCPHAGCTVTVSGAELVCPCHGSHFALDGERTAGPAPSGLEPVEIEVRGSDIVRV